MRQFDSESDITIDVDDADILSIHDRPTIPAVRIDQTPTLPPSDSWFDFLAHEAVKCSRIEIPRQSDVSALAAVLDLAWEEAS